LFYFLQDGILSANDLKAAFTSVGRSISDGEASAMVGEAPGPVNFTQMVILFAEKMAGGKTKNQSFVSALN
jgi:Ca2+-binding EF-hand superfamily protein